MKKLVTLFVLSFIIISTQAYNDRSILNLRMYDNSAFCVIVDGQKYNFHQSRYNIPNLAPGRHYIKIIKHGNRNNYYGHNNAMWLFAGYVNIPFATKVSATIDRYNHLRIIDRQSANNGYGRNQYHSKYNNAARNMSARDFEQLKFVVYKTSFDNTKLKIAKQAIRVNRVTAWQVFELMNLMTFESTKLNLARFAYRYTINKNKYYIVSSAFTFSSSIRELDRYINNFNYR